MERAVIEKTVSTRQARQCFTSPLPDGEVHVVTNRRKVVAVLMSYRDYQSFRAAAELLAHPDIIKQTLENRADKRPGISLDEAFGQAKKRKKK